jgi:hypothetical protein
VVERKRERGRADGRVIYLFSSSPASPSRTKAFPPKGLMREAWRWRGRCCCGGNIGRERAGRSEFFFFFFLFFHRAHSLLSSEALALPLFLSTPTAMRSAALAASPACCSGRPAGPAPAAARKSLPRRPPRAPSRLTARAGGGRGGASRPSLASPYPEGGLDPALELAVPVDQRPVNELAALREAPLYSWVRACVSVLRGKERERACAREAARVAQFSRRVAGSYFFFAPPGVRARPGKHAQRTLACLSLSLSRTLSLPRTQAV